MIPPLTYHSQAGPRHREAWFKCEIAPKLDAFSLKEIGAGTGSSLAALLAHSRICADSASRHWKALQKLAST